MNKNKKISPNSAYKTVFVAAMSAFIGWAFTNTFLIVRYANFDNINSQFVWLMGIGAPLPFVILAVSYAFIKSPSRLYRLYVSTVITIASLAIISTVTSLMMVTSSYWFVGGEAGYFISMQAIPIVVGFIALGLVIFLSRRLSSAARDKVLEKYFMAAIFALIGAVVFQEAYYIVGQLPYNQNLSAYVSSAIAYVTILAIFSFVYWREKARMPLRRLYVSLLIVSLVVMVVTMLSQLFSLLQTLVDFANQNQFFATVYLFGTSVALISTAVVIRAKVRTIS